jgi:hypothetical protein
MMPGTTKARITLGDCEGLPSIPPALPPRRPAREVFDSTDWRCIQGVGAVFEGLVLYFILMKKADLA